MLDKYKLLGRGYDTLSKLYSGNAIQECRMHFLNETHIKPEDKVLFVGAGDGLDVIHTAELGASATAIDISPTMMDRLLAQLSKHPDPDSLNIKTILGDVLKQEEKSKYDVVVVNFFLTIFEKSKMLSMLDHLIKSCKPGGKIIIGDFSPLSGNLLHKTAQQVYWYTAASAFFALTGSAIHELYDYRPILESKGLSILDTQEFSVLGQGAYQSLIALKD